MTGPHVPEHLDFPLKLRRVHMAVAAMRDYNDDLDRAGAAAILPYLPGYGRLTSDERDEVLARFPVGGGGS